ncbi:uncharacterized protein LOC127258506 [Andrographis paniculata]|uniref:uncharacterized protein LOC127258506 n=1 Tax=Andrographis paniculata TaxID=175694 RepID=UPI0021E78893|nr:uncharacterized protein LOC127258506 [Andrographis paniculata]
MAFSFTRLSWLWLGGKEKEQSSNGSFVNSVSSLGVDGGLGSRREGDNLRVHSFKGMDGGMLSSTSNRKAKRKGSREYRICRMDEKDDAVSVPLDGAFLPGSESDELDWSIGWLEPHAPGFQSDVEADNSFAVLVPCYKRNCDEANESKPVIPFLNGVKHPQIEYSSDGTKYVELWLSYLQKF